MPTDVLLSLEERYASRKKEAADLIAYLFLIPMVMCLGSLAVAIECPAFAAVLVAMGQK